MLLEKWKSLGLYPAMVVALEQETADSICANGGNSVVWLKEKESYSRVADAKFSVAAELAERNRIGFFVELDIFCRKNPFPYFASFKDKDLIHPGHGDVNYRPNIGMYLASTKLGPFFRGLTKVLAYSKDQEHYINQVKTVHPFLIKMCTRIVCPSLMILTTICFLPIFVTLRRRM